MIFIATGFGILVPLIWVAGAFLFTALRMDEQIGRPWDSALLLALCALAYVALDAWLSRRSPGAGKRFRHSFFFIPLRYWAPIAVAGAIYVAYFRGAAL